MEHQQIAVTVHMWKSGCCMVHSNGQRRSAASPSHRPHRARIVFGASDDVDAAGGYRPVI
jgi:hypothetical protein